MLISVLVTNKLWNGCWGFCSQVTRSWGGEWGRVLLYMVYALPASSYILKHCRE